MDPAAARLVATVGSALTTRRSGTTASARVADGVSLLAADRNAVEAFRGRTSGALELPLADGGTLTLELERYDGLLPGGTMFATDAQGAHAFTPDVTLYRGHVAGEPASWAVVAMSGEGVFGALEHGGERWNLAPAQSVPARGLAAGAAFPAHALAPERARGADATPFTCGIDATNEARYTVERALERGAASLRAGRTAAPTYFTAPRTVWKIAVDCDYEVFHNKFADNLTAASSYVLTVLGTVNLIYERDLQATLTFPYVNLWTTVNDPYTSATLGSQLTQMQGYWTTNNSGIVRSAAFLMSGRPLGGGLALIGSLCTSGYAVAAMDFTYTYPTATSTWDVDVVAHELGHVFGSWHTQSCNWSQQGMLPAATTIDSCWTSEGACATYTNHLPPDKGTIMSYCHVQFGVANGIRLEFHPLCVQRIRSIMAVSACSTQALPQPPGGPATAPIAGGVRVSWTASPSPNVLGYEVFRSPYPFDTHPTRAGFTASLQFDDAAIGANWYRVRTVRASDTSSWCPEVKGTSACGFAVGTPFNVGAGASGLATADLNSDGREDLLSLRPDPLNQLTTLFGEGVGAVGNGTFGPAFTSATGIAPRGLAVDEVTGDGVLDVVLGSAFDRAVLMHAGTSTAGVGNGGFLSSVNVLGLGFSPLTLRTADLDEDGLPDVVVATDGGIMRAPGKGAAGVPNGQFGPLLTAPVGMSTNDFILRDLDADGVLDLAVTGSLGLRVLKGVGLNGNGDGSFAPPSLTLAAGTDPEAIAAADLDVDGVNDLVVCDFADSVVHVFMGQKTAGVANGTFAAGKSYACGLLPSAVTTADWDHDGVPDVVVASDDGVGHVRLLLGMGDGRLQAPITLSTGGGGTNAVVATDFNEDGALDVIAVNRTTGTGVRISGTCPGTLSTAVTLAAPNGGESWTIGDERTVTWSKGAGVLSVDVELSSDAGAHWRTIAREILGTSWKWSVAGPTGPNTRLRVVAHGFPQSKDASNASFTLLPANSVGVEPGASPNVALAGVWPNPARRDLHVRFSLSEATSGTLELVDLAGRRVAALDLAGLGAGAHELALLRGQDLAPGLYMVRLRAGHELRMAKVAVVR